MARFTPYYTTELFFGKGSLNILPKQLPVYGKKALLIFGGRSAKENGAYNDIIEQLKIAKIKYTEFWGVKPNPVIEDANEAVKTGIKNNVEMVIAVGGGSVIDTAKLVALCIPGKNDVWKVMKGKQKPEKALPIVTVLTLAATGSEMNPFAVLQNNETKEKIGFGSPYTYPAISICDSSYSLTVSKSYTAYGLADIFAHSLEAFFGEGNSPLSDRFVISILKEIMEIATPLINNLNDTQLRDRMMWASTCALNGTTFNGRCSGDWGVHDIAHHLSLLYGVSHGASLSVVYPAWLKHHKRKANERIKYLGKELFNKDNVSATIQNIENFFREISCPVNMDELDLSNQQREQVLYLLYKNKPTGNNFALKKSDFRKIWEKMN